ncbi:MAG: cytochrome c biogenesis protein CcsA [Candidatus Accumulibacter sp.]|jgi:ABC-type uncharacterized transport system permease subunit|nr:cytochrome c biogenesis protein CcsA [Accumulibacter sp.]
MPGILLHLLPHIVAALSYAGLGYHFWHTRWNDTGKPLAPLPMQPWERGAIALVLLVHGGALYMALIEGGNLRFSFSLAVSLMLWLAVLIYWLESFRSRMDGMQPMVLPLAAMSAILPVVFPQTHEIVHAEVLGFRIHFLAAMLAYSLFTVSALNAVFMAFIERRLHHRTLDHRPASLPSILSMEILLFRLIGIAFSLLTLTLVSGLAFSEQIFGKAFVFDHMTSFALVSWIIFAALLFGRHNYGWRGKVALRWTLAGFFSLILAYIGSRFILEVLLGH